MDWPDQNSASVGKLTLWGLNAVTVSSNQVTLPAPGYIRNLRASYISTIPDGDSTFTLVLNNVPTPLTVIFLRSSSGEVVDTTHAVSVNIGDKVNYYETTTGSSGTVKMGYAYITYETI